MQKNAEDFPKKAKDIKEIINSELEEKWKISEIFCYDKNAELKGLEELVNYGNFLKRENYKLSRILSPNMTRIYAILEGVFGKFEDNEIKIKESEAINLNNKYDKFFNFLVKI